ncbi:heat shock protein DnaJ, partial [Lophium mytilinum]
MPFHSSDPWAVLGIPRNADQNDIRRAYKRLVLLNHPDKKQDPAKRAEGQERFRQVQAAYDLLKDDTER